MGEIFRITLTGTLYASVTFQNVIAFEEVGGPRTDQDIANEMTLQWCQILANGMVNTAGWRNVKIERVGSNASPFNLPIVVNGVDGVGNNEVQPAIAIKWRIHTATPGRTGKGRIYLCGYRNQLFTSGQLNGTGITNMNVRLNAIKTRYLAGNAVVLKLGVLPRGNNPEAFKAATDITMPLIPGCQRRRNLGIGI